MVLSYNLPIFICAHCAKVFNSHDECQLHEGEVHKGGRPLHGDSGRYAVAVDRFLRELRACEGEEETVTEDTDVTIEEPKEIDACPEEGEVYVKTDEIEQLGEVFEDPSMDDGCVEEEEENIEPYDEEGVSDGEYVDNPPPVIRQVSPPPQPVRHLATIAPQNNRERQQARQLLAQLKRNASLVENLGRKRKTVKGQAPLVAKKVMEPRTLVASLQLRPPPPIVVVASQQWQRPRQPQPLQSNHGAPPSPLQPKTKRTVPRPKLLGLPPKQRGTDLTKMKFKCHIDDCHVAYTTRPRLREHYKREHEGKTDQSRRATVKLEGEKEMVEGDDDDGVGDVCRELPSKQQTQQLRNSIRSMIHLPPSFKK